MGRSRSGSQTMAGRTCGQARLIAEMRGRETSATSCPPQTEHGVHEQQRFSFHSTSRYSRSIHGDTSSLNQTDAANLSPKTGPQGRGRGPQTVPCVFFYSLESELDLHAQCSSETFSKTE